MLLHHRRTRHELKTAPTQTFAFRVYIVGLLLRFIHIQLCC